MKTVIVLFALAAVAFADIYMHNPRGGNNRVNDGNNAPANRLFDSQNNNQAGYAPNDDDMMQYYATSKLTVQWTSQHGCGVNPNTDCDMIIQYRCDELMRDGTSRERPEDPPVDGDEPSADRGRHEPYVNWNECQQRERNGGLFLADQNVGNTAASTRQNGGGNRSGYECAEERDHWPYWHPSYWKDVAIMSNNRTRCETRLAPESQNVMGKNYCSDPQYNNEDDCTDNGATWELQAPWGIEAPECVDAPWGRVNIHGDAITPGAASAAHMEHAHYNWTIPEEVSSACVLRVRYNTSSYDYDGWNEIDARYNDDLSPVENDPVVTVAGMELELNINTAQFFRTFEDRSNVFAIQARPAEAMDGDIYNLNVRGKRGNNAATYPSVEYDFTPNRMHIRRNDYVHWQWTGVENNPNGNDRNNAVPVAELGLAYPLSADEDPGLFQNMEQRMSAGTSCGSEDPNLQDVVPYCNVGLVKYENEGTFHYLSTKNNAYTNRAQKGSIIVGDVPGEGASTGLIVGLSIGGAVLLAGGAGAAYAISQKGRGGGSTSRF